MLNFHSPINHSEDIIYIIFLLIKSNNFFNQKLKNFFTKFYSY